MRFYVFLLVIFGTFASCFQLCSAAEITNSLSTESLSGEELFEHDWATYSKEQQQELFRVWTAKMTKEQRKAFVESARSRQETALAARGGFRRAAATAIVNPLGIGDGLGPLHNATSCADCHEGGGAAGVDRNVILLTIDPRSPAVKSPGMTGGQQLLDVLPSLLNELGALNIETVLHDRSTNPGYDEIRNRLVDYVPGGIDDEWFDPKKRTIQAVADRPVIAGRHGGVDFYLSQRNPPALFGLGLIDRIQLARLEDLAKDQAKEGRVSGRVAGKLGWRGQIQSVHQFVSQACAGELGLSNPSALQSGDPANLTYRPPGFDMTDKSVMALAYFVAALPTPREQVSEEHSQKDIFDGESVFNSIGCADCHVPDVIPATNVFSDFLLHDMGERLQAASASAVGTATTNQIPIRTYQERGPISGAAPIYYSGSSGGTITMSEDITRPDQPQFPRGPRPLPEIDKKAMTWDDLQREWRTPPLWGVADTGPYLHDGRAKTLKEAILWHGGEAQDSTDLFLSLSPEDKTKLLGFLSTLRAPEERRGTGKSVPADEDAEEATEPEQALLPQQGSAAF